MTTSTSMYGMDAFNHMEAEKAIARIDRVMGCVNRYLEGLGKDVDSEVRFRLRKRAMDQHYTQELYRRQSQALLPAPLHSPLRPPQQVTGLSGLFGSLF